ncbi:MAG: hypothetical protein HYV95_05315 [Opitutae bacterium]|nr:hypothetical protein [Opitutae bacterium]
MACLQGIINREVPRLYVLSDKNTRPQYWLDLLSKEGRWLEGRPRVAVAGLDALVRLAGEKLKGAVIWDPAVPATLNVATTIAGVREGVVLSPELAGRYLAAWHLPVLEDLRGRFTGAETGSKKNDAYRWAFREYLAKGLCSPRLLCLFHDSWFAREKGDVGYVVTRDWAVKNRSFVFDLSPWGDEPPADDPGQRPGLDLETYRMILEETLRRSAGRHMTEMTGFFEFSKYTSEGGRVSKHEPVPTEWETVWLISPYNVYQNTSSSDCYNQSLHSQAPRAPLRQARAARAQRIENKNYLCFLMADYDSAYVLYDFLPKNWDNTDRGKLPLAWGLNPNLLDTFPDLIAYFYETASPADTFTADATAAGYFNPNRIRPEHLPLFVRHNQTYFREASMTIAPMVLDWSPPTAAVKDAYRQFAPDGFGTLVWDYHANRGDRPTPQVWKDMPILELINDANEFPGAEKTADIVANAIAQRGGGKVPAFHLFRFVWVNPAAVRDMLATLRRKHPELDFEVLDPHTFFALAQEHLERKQPSQFSVP